MTTTIVYKYVGLCKHKTGAWDIVFHVLWRKFYSVYFEMKSLFYFHTFTFQMLLQLNIIQ